jgi:TRAP transporter 4TM/12TM fusion protein
MADSTAIRARHDETPSAELQQLMGELEAEFRFRRVGGMLARLVALVAVALALFHLYTAGFGQLDNFRQRAIHLCGLLVLIFILYPAGRRSPTARPSPIDWLLVVASIATAGYIVASYEAYAFRGGIVLTHELVLGALLLVVVIEGARRTIGLALPILSGIFLVYAYAGNWVPGYFSARGFSISRILETMYLSDSGVYGIPLGVSSTFVIVFILFGAFLARVGLIEFFTDLALSVAGHTTGGTAKVAIIASALFGMINGSAIANVCTLGSFTIPLMRRTGYRPHFAGAVESTASMGGQIMPPVMGAAAFIMAENLRAPYALIAIAAIIPAALYFLACGVMVHFEAAKTGVERIPKDQLPRPGRVIRERGYLVIPAVIMVYLLYEGYSALFAGFWACVAAVIISLIHQLIRANRAVSAGEQPAETAVAHAVERWIRDMLRGMEDGVRNTLTVGVATAIVGIIIGVVALTGLGPKLAAGIVQLAQGDLVLTMILTMVASIILGTGLPTTPTYIITAAMCVPALLQLGVSPLAAHMFVFYYGILSDLTPPTAIAPYAASAIAGTDHTRTEWTSMRLALAGFLVPFAFVLNPAMLILDQPAAEVVRTAITGVLGVVALGGALEGYVLRNMTWIERGLMLIAAISLIGSSWATDAIGTGLLGLLLIWQYSRNRRAAQSQSVAEAA